MTDRTPAAQLALGSRAEEMFPTLTEAQVARIAAHGRVRQVQPGEVLIQTGERPSRFFVVTAGRLELVRWAGGTEEIVVVLQRGMFTGEATMLSGRPGLTQIRASDDSGAVIELDRDHLLALVQTDSELSDILMRAFLLRRVELIARGFGDAVLVGSIHSAETLRIKEFLTRNSHPYSYIDLDRDAGVQDILDHFHVIPEDVPVLVCRGTILLRNPSNQKIAECLGLNEAIDQTQVRDLIIIGAGCGPQKSARGRLWTDLTLLHRNCVLISDFLRTTGVTDAYLLDSNRRKSLMSACQCVSPLEKRRARGCCSCCC